MKTKFYNKWTDLVNILIKDILVHAHQETTEPLDEAAQQVWKKKLEESVDLWLDNAGKMAFQANQGKFFMQHQEDYKQIKDPFSGESGKLARDQITAGFNGWFNELLKEFPVLDNDKVKTRYSKFAKDCIGRDFHSFILARGDSTLKLVESGDLKNIGLVYKDFQFLESASHASLEAMDEYRNSPAASTVPRGPSSPAFHKEAAQPAPLESPTPASAPIQNP